MPWTREQAAEMARRRWATRPAAPAPVPPPPPPAPTDNVIPLRSGPTTLAEALQALRPSAPAVVTAPVEPPKPPAPATEISDETPDDVEDERPAPSSGNRMFSEMAASCCTTVAVVGFKAAIEAEGLTPREPADDEIETCQKHTAEAIARGLGDREVPWWAALVLSYGQLYAGMRIGAAKEARPRPPAVKPAAPADATDEAPIELPANLKPPERAPVVPPAPPPRNRGPIPFAPLPAVKAIAHEI